MHGAVRLVAAVRYMMHIAACEDLPPLLCEILASTRQRQNLQIGVGRTTKETKDQTDVVQYFTPPSAHMTEH